MDSTQYPKLNWMNEVKDMTDLMKRDIMTQVKTIFTYQILVVISKVKAQIRNLMNKLLSEFSSH